MSTEPATGSDGPGSGEPDGAPRRKVRAWYLVGAGVVALAAVVLLLVFLPGKAPRKDDMATEKMPAHRVQIKSKVDVPTVVVETSDGQTRFKYYRDEKDEDNSVTIEPGEYKVIQTGGKKVLLEVSQNGGIRIICNDNYVPGPWSGERACTIAIEFP